MHDWVHGLRLPGETLDDARRRLERCGARPEDGEAELMRRARGLTGRGVDDWEAARRLGLGHKRWPGRG
jgi:hypothetical protein